MAANAELRIAGQAVGFNALSTVGLAIDRLLIGSERLSFVRGNRGTDSTTSGFLIPVDFAGDSSASYLVIWKVNADHGRGRVPQKCNNINNSWISVMPDWCVEPVGRRSFILISDVPTTNDSELDGG